MDPKKIYELILTGREDYENDFDNDLEVSEIVEEYASTEGPMKRFAGVDKAIKDLEIAVRDFEDHNDFSYDYVSIERKLHEKMAMEFDGVDAVYEM